MFEELVSIGHILLILMLIPKILPILTDFDVD